MSRLGLSAVLQCECKPVQPVARQAGLVGDQSCGRTWRMPSCQGCAQAGDELVVAWLRRAVGEPDNEHEFALDRGGKVHCGVLERCPCNLLVHLGQFTTNDDGAVAEFVGEVSECRCQPMWRLVEHEWIGQRGKLAQARTPGLGGARQEAKEHKAVRDEARDRDRGCQRRWPRNGDDWKPSLGCSIDQFLPWIGNAGHSRVGHEGDVVVGQCVENFGKPRGWAVLVVAHQPRVDAIVLEQDTRAPRVFGSD